MIAGAALPAVTVKLEADVPLPTELVTVIGPEVAPAGTVAVRLVDEFTVNTALTPLNDTCVVVSKSVPLMNTVVPGGPLVGVKDVTVGALERTVKSVELIPTPLSF